MARAHRRRRYYAKAPPMATAGGLVIAGIGATVGYLVTDLGDRYIAGYNPTTSPAPTLPSGVTSIAQFNDVVVSAKPSLARIGWGLGMMIVGFGGGAMAPWAGLKMFLYGWGLGATAHLGGQLLNAYVVEPMFQTNGVASANGSRMFQHEIHSNNTLTPPAGAAAGTLTGLGQTPGARMTAGGTPIAALGPGGARGSLGAQPHARIPSALASRRGGLGQVAPLNFSQQAYDQIAATQNSGSGFIPGVQEGQPPPGSSPPSSTSPPPSTSPPSTTQPPGTAPPSRTQPPGCGPCELPSPCACSGTAQCVCGNCPGPNISGMGQPPDDRRDPYRHPLFRAMNQPRSSLFRRAA
ncbi:MAG TPA: hypothetical protein VK989_00655 [Polyangia bacterium]|nr:hypothetical protein [Polyangia bacterium]